MIKLEKGKTMEVFCNDALNFKRCRFGRSKIFFGYKYICRSAKFEIGEFRPFLGNGILLVWIDRNITKEGFQEMSTSCLAKKIQLDLGIDVTPSQLSLVLMKRGYSQTLTKNGLHAYVKASFSSDIIKSYDNHELYGDWFPKD
jgi:hypothetical protein